MNRQIERNETTANQNAHSEIKTPRVDLGWCEAIKSDAHKSSEFL